MRVRGRCRRRWGQCTRPRARCTRLWEQCLLARGHCPAFRGHGTGLRGHCIALRGRCTGLRRYIRRQWGEWAAGRGRAYGARYGAALCRPAANQQLPGIWNDLSCISFNSLYGPPGPTPRAALSSIQLLLPHRCQQVPPSGRGPASSFSWPWIARFSPILA